MATARGGPHTLVVYGGSAGADGALRRLADSSSARGGRLTVVTLLAQEAEVRGCCDTRSALWNEITRDLAQADVARAAQDDVPVEVVVCSGRRLADAVVNELRAREADEVVLLGAPLGPLARRRLRRISPVPLR
jgi:nucleotide-binding universal stress UspA family protein